MKTPWVMNTIALLTLLFLPGMVPALDTSAPAAVSTHGTWTWHVETVDAAGNVGQYTALALDANGRPHISYYGSSDLKYAGHNGTSWVVQTLDAAGDTGLFTAIAAYGAGNVGISYYDATNGDLKYATPASAVSVDTTGDTGRWTSLVVDVEGFPHISYYDASNGDLRYAYYDAGIWRMQTVDAAGDVGRYTSLALRAPNRPCISYYDVTHGRLKYAEYDPIDASWIIQVVESGGDQGLHSSLALDAGGRPHITYATAGGANLKYAYHDGVSWKFELIDVDTYGHNSLALNAAGVPHVSYWSPAGLRYATYVGPGLGNCGTGAWTCETVDPGATLGAYNSLRLDAAGRPHISYRDDTNMDLKYASACLRASFVHAPEPACVFAAVQFTSTVEGVAPFFYQWSFGDGATSTLSNPVHSYNQPGVYTAALTVTSGCGLVTVTNTVTVWGTPTAGYTYAPEVVCAGAPVSFTNTTVASGTLLYQWNFDDGTFSALVHPTHTWAAAGVYDVALLAQNGCGFDLYIEEIAAHGAPVVGMVREPLIPEVGVAVTFTAVYSGALPAVFDWDLGDGSRDTGLVVTHVYTLPGTYDILLTGTTGCGAGIAGGTITVLDLPRAAFSTNAPVCAGAEVVFTNASEGGLGPLSYHWDLGDGAFSTAEHPTHTYALAGLYTATLTATSAFHADVVAHPVEILSAVQQISFTYSPASPDPGGPVTFVGTAQGLAPIFYAWDLGDGATAAGPLVLYTYAVTGNYTVVLTGTNACGAAAISRTVEVAYCHAPAGLGVDYRPRPLFAGRPATFTATLAAGDRPINYGWDFGDGSPPTSGPAVPHTYDTPGVYTITLTAINVCGMAQEKVPVAVTVPVYHVYLPLVLRDFFVDGYEPDNTPAQAKALPIGGVQRRNLYPAGDVDWVYVELSVGRAYLFSTGDLGGDVDTVLELYDTDGTTLLAQNDDCTPYTKASCLTISAPASGRYYLKVRDYLPGAGGPGNVYTLMASEP